MKSIILFLDIKLFKRTNELYQYKQKMQQSDQNNSNNISNTPILPQKGVSNPPFAKHQSLPPRSKSKLQPKSGGFKIDGFVHRYQDQNNKPLNRQGFLQLKKDHIPGPGEYEVQFFEKKKLGMIMKESFEYKLQQAIHGPPPPGPGSYNTPSSFDFQNGLVKAKSTITFAPPRLKRFTQKKITETPGPGYYDTQKNAKGHSVLSTVTSSMGGFLPKSKKITDPTFITKVPGPGTYESNDYFKNISEKRRPQIQFKFVHGHPS